MPVTLFSPLGELVQYAPLAERIHAFYKAYPVDQYSVITEYAQDPFKAGSLESVYIFKASLVDVAGRVICTAHSRRLVTSFKDFESAETSARQRLVAALGFDGGILDSDEHADFSAQNLKATSRGNDDSSSVSTPPTDTVTHVVKPQTSPVQESVACPHGTTHCSSGVSPSLMQYLNVLCKQRNLGMPMVATNAEAREAIERIKAGGVA